VVGRISPAILGVLLAASGCMGLFAAGQRDREGQELRRQHRYLEAALAYEDAYLERQRVLGPEHRDVALTMTAAGQCFNLGGQPRRGLVLLARALPIVEREVGPMSDSVGRTLYAMAGAEWKLGLLDDAEAHQRRAVSIAERSRWEPLELSNLLPQLGRILVDHGQADEGYRLHLQAFAMRRALNPPAPALVAQSQLQDRRVVNRTTSWRAGRYRPFRPMGGRSCRCRSCRRRRC
jgi:tetratricopeptide (TPR) repeat protein